GRGIDAPKADDVVSLGDGQRDHVRRGAGEAAAKLLYQPLDGKGDALRDLGVLFRHVHRTAEAAHKAHVPLEGPAAGFAHRQLLPEVREMVEFEPAGNPGISPLAAGKDPDLPGRTVVRSLSPDR